MVERVAEGGVIEEVVVLLVHHAVRPQRLERRLARDAQVARVPQVPVSRQDKRTHRYWLCGGCVVWAANTVVVAAAVAAVAAAVVVVATSRTPGTD